MDQGPIGNRFAASLDDYLIDMPHAGADGDDYRKLGELRMKRHEYETKCFYGEGSVRALCVGEWIGLSGHPEIDTHPENERQFIVTRLEIDAINNLPTTVTTGAPSLWQKLKGEQPSYRTATVWKLIGYGDGSAHPETATPPTNVAQASPDGPATQPKG